MHWPYHLIKPQRTLGHSIDLILKGRMSGLAGGIIINSLGALRYAVQTF